MVKLLLRAGMVAPSADDERPWHFIVVNDRVQRKKITGVHPSAHMVDEAPGVILVCGDLSLQKAQGFWIQDCSAATENILIEAHFQGLGAVWLGIYPVEGRIEGFRRIFNLPDNVIPFSLVVFGFPKENKEPANRYDVSRIHYDCW